MARDLYDLWFLMERGIKPDLDLINSKLSLYDKTYSREEMNKRIAELEKSWKDQLPKIILYIGTYSNIYGIYNNDLFRPKGKGQTYLSKTSSSRIV